MLKNASRAAVLAATLTAVMLPVGAAFAADSLTAAPQHASQSEAQGKDIGGGLEAAVKDGRLVVSNIGDHHVLATLKPGETYDKGVYVKFNTDGKTFTAQTQGGRPVGRHKTGNKAAGRPGTTHKTVSPTARAAKPKTPRGAVAAGEAPASGADGGTAMPVAVGGVGALTLLGGGAAVMSRRKAVGNR